MRSASIFRRPDGVALVTVLAVVLLLAAIAISLVVAMRMERRAAGHFSARVAAEALAMEGVEAARATLLGMGSPGRYWIAGPGWTASWPTNSLTAISTNALSSGESTGTPDGGFDLNRPVLGEDGRTALTGAPVLEAMEVGWVYVFADGFRGRDLSHESVSEVVGRYAYWGDTETSRIDLNSAWQRSNNTNPPSSPSQISLDAIPGITRADADLIHSQARVARFLTPDEPRRIDPGISTTLSSNRFLTTTLSLEEDLNPWGEPKIVLTTQENLAGGRPFLDILVTPNSDPCAPANLNALNAAGGKVQGAVQQIAELLNRSVWPYRSGGSEGFGSKFGADPAAANQLAVDIIEHVRASETTRNYVPTMIRGEVVNGLFRSAPAPSGANALIGTSRKPLITEMALWVGDSPLPTTPTRLLSHVYEVRALIELHSPAGFGMEPISVSEFKVQIDIPELAAPRNPDSNRITLDPAQVVRGADPLEAGDYLVLSIPLEVRFQPGVQPRDTPTLPLRIALIPRFHPGLTDVAPLASGWQNSAICPINPPGPPFDIDAATSLQTSDPRVNSHRGDWVASGAGNTFGAPNALFASAQSGVSTPPRDGVGAEVGLRTPPAKGTAANPSGVFVSVADLGAVQTGRFGALLPGVPWRTLRLRPTSGADITSLPDWAVTELFVAPPVLSSEAPIPPGTRTTAGRINLNSKIQPFTNQVRIEPLVALMTNVAHFATSEAVQSISEAKPAADGFLRVPGVLVAGGEICELEDLGGPDEAAEIPLRNIMDLATVRSGTFRVYSTAQALKRIPGGTLAILAEKSVVATLQKEGDSCSVVTWKSVPF